MTIIKLYDDDDDNGDDGDDDDDEVRPKSSVMKIEYNDDFDFGRFTNFS